MAFNQTPDVAITGVQKVTAYINLLRDYIAGGENLEGAAISVAFEDDVLEQDFNSYMVYTIRLPAQKTLTEEGQVTYDPFEI